MQAKKWLVVILSSSLLFASSLIGTASTEQKPVNHPLSQAANTGTYSTKDEVIYGKLDAHGQVNSVYVVNTFHMEEPGEIIDYGNYANVRNLTNLSDIQVSQQEVHLQADENEFYYQGELVDPSLPWDIDIDYVFEGEQVSPTELPGQSGHLEIKITTSANETIDPLFFKNYLLQISLTLNSAIFDDIQTPKGTTANIGKDKQISFTILPDQTEELIISA